MQIQEKVVSYYESQNGICNHISLCLQKYLLHVYMELSLLLWKHVEKE